MSTWGSWRGSTWAPRRPASAAGGTSCPPCSAQSWENEQIIYEIKNSKLLETDNFHNCCLVANLILSSWSLMDSTATLNSSEMSSLWASNRRMILSALSANHLRTEVKSYPRFRVCFSPARIPKVSPEPSIFCWELSSMLICTWGVKHVEALQNWWPCCGALKSESRRYFSLISDFNLLPSQKWSSKLF